MISIKVVRNYPFLLVSNTPELPQILYSFKSKEMATEKEKEYEELIHFMIEQLQRGLKNNQVESVVQQVLKVVEEKMTIINKSDKGSRHLDGFSYPFLTAPKKPCLEACREHEALSITSICNNDISTVNYINQLPKEIMIQIFSNAELFKER